MRKWRGWKDVKSDWWKIENGSDPAQTSWKEPEDLAAVWWCVMEAEPPKPFALQSQPPDVRRKRGRSTKYEKRFHMPQKLSSIIMSVWILFTLLNPQRMSCVSLWWYKCATMCYRSFLTQPVLCATGVQELRPRLVLRPGDEVRLPAAVRRVRSRGQRLPRRPPSPAGRHLPGKKKKNRRREHLNIDVTDFTRSFNASLRFQMGGDFLLDDAGKVLLCHPCKTPFDRPTVNDILQAAERAKLWRSIWTRRRHHGRRAAL